MPFFRFPFFFISIFFIATSFFFLFINISFSSKASLITPRRSPVFRLTFQSSRLKRGRGEVDAVFLSILCLISFLFSPSATDPQVFLFLLGIFFLHLQRKRIQIKNISRTIRSILVFQIAFTKNCLSKPAPQLSIGFPRANIHPNPSILIIPSHPFIPQKQQKYPRYPFHPSRANTSTQLQAHQTSRRILKAGSSPSPREEFKRAGSCSSKILVSITVESTVTNPIVDYSSPSRTSCPVTLPRLNKFRRSIIGQTLPSRETAR